MSSHPEALIPINVWLSGRSYRIRVAPQDEGRVRKAAKKADELITDLRRHYAGKDDQDFIAMCLLMYATESAKGTGTDEQDLLALAAAIDEVLPAKGGDPEQQ